LLQQIDQLLPLGSALTDSRAALLPMLSRVFAAEIMVASAAERDVQD